MYKATMFSWIDSLGISRIEWIHRTILTDTKIIITRQMFPYKLPLQIEHFMVWSTTDLTEDRIALLVAHLVIYCFVPFINLFVHFRIYRLSFVLKETIIHNFNTFQHDRC